MKSNNMVKIILIIILLSLVNIFIFQAILEGKSNKKPYEHLEKGYEEIITQAYQINPSILKFDNNNKAILSVEVLLNGVTNGVESISLGNMIFDNDQNECVGYFIVLKNQDGSLSVNGTHMCDMVDY